MKLEVEKLEKPQMVFNNLTPFMKVEVKMPQSLRKVIAIVKGRHQFGERLFYSLEMQSSPYDTLIIFPYEVTRLIGIIPNYEFSVK